MTNQEAKEKIFYQWQDFLEHNIDYAGISEAYKMAIKALEQGDVLQEIKKEIELKEKTLTDKYGQVKYGVWTDDVCNVFDKYIEKYSNT